MVNEVFVRNIVLIQFHEDSSFFLKKKETLFRFIEKKRWFQSENDQESFLERYTIQFKDLSSSIL